MFSAAAAAAAAGTAGAAGTPFAAFCSRGVEGRHDPYRRSRPTAGAGYAFAFFT